MTQKTYLTPTEFGALLISQFWQAKIDSKEEKFYSHLLSIWEIDNEALLEDAKNIVKNSNIPIISPSGSKYY